VVPGYVKCPKCHAALPRVTFKPKAGAGGTALERSGGVPWPALVVALVAATGLVVWLAVRHGNSAKASTGSAQVAPDEVAGPTQPVAAPVAAPTPPPLDTPAPTPATPQGPRPDEVARQLKASLDRQRLWSTVSIVGDAIEVRSSACADPAIGPVFDTIVRAARAAGLTQLRCVSQSGGVVSQRAL
jgi:hypothetical protein